jgi:RHS repeat-associated protein
MPIWVRELVGHMTRDEFFRHSPAPGTPCGTAGSPCTQRWSYDGDDRLIREDDGRGKVTGYVLKPAGGIKKKFDGQPDDVFYSAEFDGTRVVTTTLHGATERLFYDGEGNLDCITTAAGTADDCSDNGDPSANVLQDFSYDYRNRLTAWERPAQDRSTVYEHDALDRPITETETVGSQTTRNELSYVGATRTLADEQETGTHQKTRSYSHDAYGRLAAVSYRSGGGQTHELSYAYDPHGNVSMLLDQNGQPKAAYGYSGYGEPDEALTAEQLPGSTDAPGQSEQVNPFRYSAKRTEALSGKIDMGARQFGPALGQFLQADRYDGALADLGLASDPLTNNRYALAGGNPISYMEVDGHMPCPKVGNCGGNATNVNRSAANAQRASGGGDSAVAPLTDVSSDPDNYPGTSRLVGQTALKRAQCQIRRDLRVPDPSE